MPIDAPLRAVNLGSAEAALTRTPSGTLYLRATEPLGPYPARLTERLVHWARVAPDRPYLAGRSREGGWRILSYRAALAQVERIAGALLRYDLSPERPVAILSENDVEHALLALAAMHVGVPYAPISPAYSLVSRDFARLRHILGLLTPGLVFAADARRFATAIGQVVPDDVPVIASEGEIAGRRTLPFGELTATDADSGAVASAHARVGADTVAKILFTSGSTAQPKGVINTHRMLCSNQQMYRQHLPFLGDEPPVLMDWSPWHHTAGGNSNFGLVLYNGGTFYIDDGKPTPQGIERTVQNLREIAPTLYIGVPRSFEAIVPYLEREPALRAKFFSRLRMLFYAGAALPKQVWDALERLAVAACGERVLISSGLGSTETGPYALGAPWDSRTSGIIGLPAPGVETKLVPNAEKLEIRLRSPSITPGYWRQDELTRAAFDEEGFYRMGDAVRFVDPGDPLKGLLFDGRVSEDFKLTTGTWVSVGPLRIKLIQEAAPHVQDAVVAGHDRDEIGVLIFPNVQACRALCPDLPPGAHASEVASNRNVRRYFHDLLARMARASTGSSNRIARALLLSEPPSFEAGEITDKGSINQRTVLRERKALVEELYREPPGPAVIVSDRPR